MADAEHSCYHCGKRGAIYRDLLWSYTIPSSPECEEHRGTLAALEEARRDTLALPFAPMSA